MECPQHKLTLAGPEQIIRYALIFVTTALLGCSAPTPQPAESVADATEQAECGDAPDTQTMRECFARALARADSALLVAVDALRSRSAHPALVDSAQASWVEFRRLTCAVAGSQYEGGSFAPVEILSCMEGETSSREAAVRLQLRAP